MTEIKNDSPLPSSFYAMITTLTALLQYPNEFSSNVFALVLYWFKDVLEYCGGNQFHSKEINEKIRKEFENIVFSLVISASKSYVVQYNLLKFIMLYIYFFLIKIEMLHYRSCQK